MSLATQLQDGVPLVRDPWGALGVDLEEIQALDSLREISAVLEGSALDHDSALVAGKVPSADLERVAQIISAHPTVTHNYERNHAYNLWFTLAVPREMGLERVLELLEQETGAGPFQPLRRTRTFKIRVRFDPATGRNAAAAHKVVEPEPVGPLNLTEQAMFRALQTPLPLVEDPFARLWPEPEALLAFAQRHLGGAIRRYGATFRHRRLGVRGNAMTVWQAEDTAALGLALAELPEVSHCYARNPLPDFPWTLYAMMHGPDVPTTLDLARQTAQRLGVAPPLALVSVREFKKCRLRYFLPETEAWFDARMRRTA